ncbi:MAG: hypothetical protein JNL60_04335 [Bacteroidia bacterium]|nr:hypothetical protein [Bacteroidia bacterium]
MCRIASEKLRDVLVDKKKNFGVRVTTHISGFTKNRFLDDCIKRDFNESKLAKTIFDTYYAVIEQHPELREKEPDEIKRFILRNLKG